MNVRIDMCVLVFSLSYSFIHKYCRTDTDVERVETAEHRYADMSVGSLAPLVGETCGFCSHDDGCGSLHVYIVIKV